MFLTPDSKRLYDIYKNCFLLENTDLKINYVTLKVFKEFFELFTKSTIHADSKLKAIVPVNLKTLPVSSNYFNIIENIRSEIEETFDSYYKFSYQLKHRKINIYISGKNITHNLYKIMLYKIIFWLDVVTSFTSNDRCSKNLDIYLYLSLQKKILPTREYENIGKNHVNTGFTYTCIPNSEIFIFRLEEWYKVFIHETIHNFGLDFSLDDTTSECILKTFKVRSLVKLYEAYTDSWAKILNILVCVFLSNKNITLENFQNKSHTYILYETIHIFIQSYKILKKMGLEYKDIFDERKGYELFKEETNVLAYYVINSLLFSDYQLFIRWCCFHNTNILQFNNENQKKFCNFVTDTHKSDLVIKNINEIKKFWTRKKFSKFIENNMRKSLFEGNLTTGSFSFY
jgi:hypothetical protein